MKIIAPSLILISLSLTAFAAEQAPVVKPKEQYGAVNVTEDDVLKKLLSVNGVDRIYKTCKEDHSIDLDKIPGCIWDKLDDNQKKQVKEIYAEESSKNKKESGRSIASEKVSDSFKTNLTDRKVSVGIDYSTDPAVKVLSEFFGKKLEEILAGDSKNGDKTIKTIDHSKFIELYTNELGKSIVNSFTSYCMEANPKCREAEEGKKPPLCLSSANADTRKGYVQDNLKEINGAKFTDDEGNVWLKCITDVTKVCYDIKSTSTDADEKYSNQKACLIVDFVKAARKNLLAANEQKEFYKSLEGKGIGIASNMEVVDNKKAATADKLTEITSADVEKKLKDKNNKEISIAEANNNTIKEADECAKGGNIADESKCKKFLDTNADQNTAAVADFGLRQIAKGEELDEKLKDDKNVEAYLTEEGFSKDQIKDMMAKDNIDAIKEKIKNRFLNEKNAIVKEMADKIRKKTTSEDGKISENDTTKIGTIRNELSSRNEDLKNLIHFNNIVSSYLVIQEGDNKDKRSRNTASLMAEVNSMKDEDAKKMKENIKNNKDLKGEETSSTLEVKDINEFFLKYTNPDEKQGQ